MNAIAARVPFLKFRLSLMMFLQYAVWGVWLPVLGGYLGSPLEKGGLGFSGGQIGMILGTAGACGAILAPFIAGQVADRLMNAEKALGLLLSYHAGLPSGPCIVLLAGLAYLISVIAGPVHGLWRPAPLPTSP